MDKLLDQMPIIQRVPLRSINQWVRIFLILFVTGIGLYSPKADGVDLRGTTQLESEFFRDVRDRKLSRWSLSDAFFIASGIRTETDLNRARAWLDDKVKQARVDLSPYRGVRKKADYLLRWIHSQMFSRYRATATDALAIIRTGHFNCLSSCIIYGIIAQKLGLKVRGVAVDKHAFCRVYQGRKGWDVETTTAMGFNPGRKIRLDRAVVSVPRSQYRNRRELKLIEMIGLIYTNHMGLSRAFPTSQDRLLAYQKAVLFFPKDKQMHHNLIALHGKVIDEELNYKRWKSAYLYVDQLKQYDRKNEYWPDLTLSIIDRILNTFVQARKIGKAIKYLREQAQQHPELREPLGYLLGSVLAKSSLAWIQTQKFARGKALYLDALKAPQHTRRRGRGPKKRGRVRISKANLKVYQHNYFAGLNNAIITGLKHRQSSLVKELAKATIQQYPNHQSMFKQLLRSAEDMEAEEQQRQIYNEILQSTQQNQWAQALKQVKSGLKRFPRSRTFLELRAKVEPIKLATDIADLIRRQKIRQAQRLLKRSLDKYPRHNALRQVRRWLHLSGDRS